MARILIIDDDSMSRALLIDIINQYSKDKYDSKWDLRFTEVKDPIEALDVMTHHAFELIITDILMARMDGYSFIKEVRKNKDNSDLPIVVISAIDGIELEYQCKRAGASMWFTKPINPKDFSEKVFSLIAER